ncbi:DUF6263 family protein [Chryseobacterium turcicum]|uniref:DUF6263 family protein n=1 Tax=Chryseobacterium turcicum TaxID=2898076 RepID=A0A9Q3V1W3_9FLAO|nr:DUF6263 family protein [Chryseobacterium turcicum]MCD1117309.1 DUF6263 family protein [Chryseobacterium turcicum]
MKKTSTILFILTLLASCQKKEIHKEDLSLNLKKGYEQTLIYTTSTVGNKNGEMNDTTEVKYKVDSVDQDKNYYITGEVLRMNFSQNMFGETIYYDSRDQSNSDFGLGAEIKPVINNPFTFKIDKHGKVLEKHKFKAEISKDLDPSQYTLIPLSFPNESVDVGFMWKGKVINTLTKFLPVTTDYTYRGIKDGKIEVSVLSRMSGMSNVLKDTEINGKYLFDSKTKALISAERQMPVQSGGGTVTFEIIQKMEGFN